jgi:hypothetical protein
MSSVLVLSRRFKLRSSWSVRLEHFNSTGECWLLCGAVTQILGLASVQVIPDRSARVYLYFLAKMADVRLLPPQPTYVLTCMNKQQQYNSDSACARDPKRLTWFVRTIDESIDNAVVCTSGSS